MNKDYLAAVYIKLSKTWMKEKILTRKFLVGELFNTLWELKKREGKNAKLN